MSYSEWKSKRHEDHAVFEAFFRANPLKGKYTIFAGLDEVLLFIERFRFKPEHIAYLRASMPDAEEGYFEWLSSLDCSKL